jgi:hypothetical protein
VYLRGSVCPECFGPVETTIESHERQGKTLYTHRNSCRECLFTIHVPVEVAAAFHPTALHLLWDHGVSLLDRPLWEFFELIASDVIVTDVVSTDPTELTCTISLDDESRSFAVDETLQATPTAPTAD